ncbi:hypothetical protein MBLNU13_g04980t1 [Cladosporium sp. NU13]
MTEHPAKERKIESNGSETENAAEKKSPTTSPTSKPNPVAPATSSPSDPAKYTRGDLVTLLIGHDEQELVVYGHLMARTSEFFEAALKKEWKEGQTCAIKLPEEDTKTTMHYLDFVCGQGLPTREIKVYGDIDEEDREEYLVLAELYAFGERVLDKRLRNSIIGSDFTNGLAGE